MVCHSRLSTSNTISLKKNSKKLPIRNPRNQFTSPLQNRRNPFGKMKRVSGSIVSAKEISLSKSASILNSFISLETGASEGVSEYLRRTSSSLNNLVRFHGKGKSFGTKTVDCRAPLEVEGEVKGRKKRSKGEGEIGGVEDVEERVGRKKMKKKKSK